jgi:hypothetical protein
MHLPFSNAYTLMLMSKGHANSTQRKGATSVFHVVMDKYKDVVASNY